MNLRKVKFAKALLEGKSQAKAAEEAGYKGKALAMRGSKLSRDPEVKSIKASLYEEACAEVKLKLTDSVKVIKDAHSATQGINPDHGVRLKAAEMNLKARKVIGQPEESGNNTVNLALFIGQAMEKSAEREQYING